VLQGSWPIILQLRADAFPTPAWYAFPAYDEAHIQEMFRCHLFWHFRPISTMQGCFQKTFKPHRFWLLETWFAGNGSGWETTWFLITTWWIVWDRQINSLQLLLAKVEVFIRLIAKKCRTLKYSISANIDAFTLILHKTALSFHSKYNMQGLFEIETTECFLLWQNV